MSLPNLAASASSSSSIDSILLKRDRLLGTKTNVHLEKLQTSRDKRAESTEKSRNLLDKISFKSRNIAKAIVDRKHQGIWTVEKERLERWRQYLTASIHSSFTGYMTAAPAHSSSPDPLLKELEQDDKIHKEECKHIWRENMSGALDTTPDALAQELVNSVYSLTLLKPKKGGDRNGFRKQLDILQKEVQEQVAADLEDVDHFESELAVLESKLSGSKECHRLELMDDDFFVQMRDGTITPFHKIKYLDAAMQNQHLKQCLVFTEWYDRQLLLLKDQYADIVDKPHGGRRVEEYKRFIKIKDEFSFYREDDCGSGVPFSMFVERVLLEIPSLKSKDEVLSLYQWTSRHVSYTQHKESLLRTSLKNIDEFVQETLNGVALELQMYTQAQDREKLERVRLTRVESSHADLEVWREGRRKEMERENLDKARQMADQVVKDLARQRKEEERREEIREMIEAKRKEEESRAARAKEMEELIRVKEEEEQRALAKINEKRVGYRQRERELKALEQQKKLEFIQAQKRELQERLQELKKTVAVDVERDWNRAIQATCSYQNHIKEADEDSSNNILSSWTHIPGFSSETILKDTRMQLSIALFKNGLSSSSYGNQILNSLRPPVKRLDTISQFKFAY